MDHTLQTYNTNGVTLHYTKSGSGQPLLFIHGSISDYRTWTNIQSTFSDQYECYSLSRRFQYPGQYPVGGDSCVDSNTRDLASFVKDRKLSPAIIIGHSFGGFIALNFAIQFPELVRSIVVEEPIFAPALAKNPKSPFELLRLLFKNFRAGKSFARLGIKGIDPTFRSLAMGETTSAQKTFIDGVTDGKKTPGTLDELTRLQLEDNIEALAGEDPFNNNLTMDDLKKIKCPTLLLSGTESPYVFQYINEKLKRFIHQSQLISIKNSGHWIHLDQKALYTKAVKEFLV